jgi:nitroreductase
MSYKNETSTKRPNELGIQSLIINRWSPRAMSGEILTRDELAPLFEAARWAPSSFNNQPWRFAYALKNSEFWASYFGLLVEANQVWCEKAGALIVVLSKTTFDYNGKPAKTHSFDTGAAWQSLALEGSARGFVVHAMQGFDYDKAKLTVKAPDDHQVECMIAIGKPGRKEDLPQKLQDSEVPSLRKPLPELIREGRF